MAFGYRRPCSRHTYSWILRWQIKMNRNQIFSPNSAIKLQSFKLSQLSLVCSLKWPVAPFSSKGQLKKILTYFQSLWFIFNLTLYQFQAQNLSILCQSIQTRGWRPVTQVQAWPCRAGATRATPPSTTAAGWWTPTPPWTTSRTSRSPSPRSGSYLRRPCSARRRRPCRPRHP